MALIGWIIMAVGILLQVLVPLGALGRPMGLMFGIPTQLALVFLGTWTLVVGLLIVFFAWLMPYARRLDESVES